MLKDKKKKVKFRLVLLVVAAILLPVIWPVILQFEGTGPSVTFDFPYSHIGSSQKLSGTVSDTGKGVRKLHISILKDGRESVLVDKVYPSAGFFKGGTLDKSGFQVVIEHEKFGITDGKAIMRTAAFDYSWRGWFNGNRTYMEKDVVIDTIPPEIDILSGNHNVSQGGSCLLVYRVSEPGVKSGVSVGGKLFPGYPGHFKDKSIYMAFFALDYKHDADANMFVSATDQAGNTARSGCMYFIKRKTFPRDNINISDSFLRMKMPEFSFDDKHKTLIDRFLEVNRNIRKNNYEEITSMGRKSDDKLYWDGVFLRMKGKKKAGFADHRTYKYNGRAVDRQVHLGVDLADIKRAQVKASNTGKVIFTDKIGIYGKTVVIDHGFGLLSTYSHLSEIKTHVGDIIEKNGVIGLTGTTGLAGGDHLHFGMLVHDTFVNPVEWWDASWVKNNITSKINDARARIR